MGMSRFPWLIVILLSGCGDVVDGASVDAQSADARAVDGRSVDALVDSAIVVPDGVFLWTGSGGGGPPSDLYMNDVVALFDDMGVPVARGDVLPGDFAENYGTLFYMNPIDVFEPAVNVAAIDLVNRGGRLVLIMEHCKNGCWGNADEHNALLAGLGSSMRFFGDGGAPLSETSLDILPVPPLTDGVGTLMVYYSGHVEVGAAGIALGSMPG